MKILDAPWRGKYIRGKKSKECIFCKKKDQKDNRDIEDYILFKGNHVFVIMNIYPYNAGHIMITPYRHAACISELNNEEVIELSLLSQQSINALKKALTPEGFNAGMNLGRVAGAGVVGHVHLHIVPRWTGDTNFMPVTAKIKVLSEDLDTTYKNLLPFFKDIKY